MPQADREAVILGQTLRNVGRVVLYNDRVDVIEARQQGKVARPLAAIVIGVAVSSQGEFTGLDLAVIHPEHGLIVKRNQQMSPPSENGDEPGWFESVVKEPPQQVDFTTLRELVQGGISAELDSLITSNEHIGDIVRQHDALAERVARLEAAMATARPLPPVSDHDFEGSDGGPLPSSAETTDATAAPAGEKQE